MDDILGLIFFIILFVGGLIALIAIPVWYFPNTSTDLYHNNTVACLTVKQWKTFNDTSTCYHLVPIPAHEYK